MIKRTIYCGSPAYLSVRNNQLIVKNREDDDEKSVPIEDIGYLEMDNIQIVCSAALLARLAEHNVVIGICNEKRMPTALTAPLQGNTLHAETLHIQAAASEPLKKRLWGQIVRQKIVNQAAVMEQNGHGAETLKRYAKQVRAGDPDNREAAAAAHYWRKLFGGKFRRDPDGDGPPNAFLNYAYAVLRASAARALVGAGLHPALGVHHRSRYNAYALADDLMEPYRPYADMLTIYAMAAMPNAATLNKDVKRELLRLPILDIRGTSETRPLSNHLTLAAAALKRCLAGEDKTLILPNLDNEKNKEL